MVETRATGSPGQFTFRVSAQGYGPTSDIGPLITTLNSLALAPVLRYDSRYQDIAETDWTHGPSVILPPVNYYRLASFMAHSVWHSRCVAVKATAVAGESISVRQRRAEDDPEGLNPAEKKYLESMVRCANPHGESLQSIIFKLQYDLEAVGNAYLEVVRDEKGRPAALYHCPAVNIRVARDAGGRAGGYWQVEQWGLSADSSRRRAFFRLFGDSRRRYLQSGQMAPMEADPRALASELLHVKSYNLASSFYGLPDVFPAVLAMEGDRAAAFWNADAFQYNTIPRMIITFLGGEPNEETLTKIEKHFTEMRPGKNHAPLVLFGMQDAGGMAPDVARVQVDKLEQRDEAGYIQYRERNRDEIIFSHGVPPDMLGITAAGSSVGTSDGARRNFRANITRPRQVTLEALINEHVIADPVNGMGVEAWVVALGDIEQSNSEFALARTEHLRQQVAAGLMTINEARARMGLPLYDNMPIADTPFVMAPGGAWLLDKLLSPDGNIAGPGATPAPQTDQAPQAGQSAGAALGG